MFIHAYLLLNASIAHEIYIYGRGSNKLFALTNIAKCIGYSVGFTPKLFCCSLQNFSYTFDKIAKDSVQCTRSCNIILTILLHVKCLQCFATYLKYNSLYKLHVIK